MKSIKNKILSLMVILSLIGSTNARTEDAVFIEKDQKAPFSGILFTELNARQIRSDLLEADKTSLRYESVALQTQNLGRLIELKNEEIELYKRANQRLVQQSNTSENMKYVWFGLGILATGIAVYGASGLSK